MVSNMCLFTPYINHGDSGGVNCNISDYREYSALTTWCSMCWTPKTGPWKQDPRFSALGNRQSCDVRSSWWSWRILTSRCSLPSGKHTKNYRKSPFWMGKLTISTGPFSIAMLAYQRVLCGKIEVWFIDDPRYPQVTVRVQYPSLLFASSVREGGEKQIQYHKNQDPKMIQRASNLREVAYAMRLSFEGSVAHLEWIVTF